MSKINLEQLAKKHGTPLFLLSKTKLHHNLQKMRSLLPRVTPYYAVKANPQDAILKEFTKDEKMGFDVASKGEMERVLAAGGNPERMIFANTVKTPESLKYAVSKGVKMMTFDSLPELQKIAKYAPKAKVLVRIKVSNIGSVVELSIKFGCDPSDAIPLLIEAVKLGLQPVGVSFHVGSQCTNVENYLDAFEVASIILNDAKLKQIHLNIIDIGGGFPIQHFDADEDYFTKMAPMIRKEIDRLFDNHIQVISEPGRALCGPAGTLIMSVIGKSIRDNKNWYYCDDGVYGSLSGMIFDHCKYQFKYFKKGALHLSAIAGPTCDSLDVMSMSESLPELQIGDLIYIENIGAYSTASNTHFNFISQAKIIIID